MKERKVHMSVYSLRDTIELNADLESNGIKTYFELIIGGDVLDSADSYTNATRKSEECFQLEHEHQYVVVCQDDDVVEAAIQEGLRTLVVKDGADIDMKLEEKCWKSIDSLEDIYVLFEKSRILFE